MWGGRPVFCKDGGDVMDEMMMRMGMEKLMMPLKKQSLFCSDCFISCASSKELLD